MEGFVILLSEFFSSGGIISACSFSLSALGFYFQHRKAVSVKEIREAYMQVIGGNRLTVKDQGPNNFDTLTQFLSDISEKIPFIEKKSGVI